jgi:uncharacterized protein HemX
MKHCSQSYLKPKVMLLATLANGTWVCKVTKGQENQKKNKKTKNKTKNKPQKNKHKIKQNTNTNKQKKKKKGKKRRRKKKKKKRKNKEKEGKKTYIYLNKQLGQQPQYLPTRHGFDFYHGVPYSVDMGAQLKYVNSF